MDLVKIVIGIITKLIRTITSNPYSFETQFGSAMGYFIVMTALVIGILIILGVIFLFLREKLNGFTGMPILSTSFSVSIMLEFLGYFSGVVTMEFFSIIAEIVGFTIIFFVVFYSIYYISIKLEYWNQK
ncbi:MAG TPA: hypothetical protein VIO11_09735 [Candidatus Methanoperedens sp.]